MSGDPEQEYFADGIAEDIITALSSLRWLFVIARNSSFTYKGHAVDIKQVGRELGVRYVLEGSVRRAANRVRITAQLIDAVTGVITGPNGTVCRVVHRDSSLANKPVVAPKILSTSRGVVEPKRRKVRRRLR